MPRPLPRPEFRALFEEHRDAVYGFLWRLTRDPHEAEDLTQETFVKFWRRQEQFRGDGSLPGYLRRIGYRLFLDSRSRRAAANPPLRLDQAPELASAGEEQSVDRREGTDFLVSRVLAALGDLPERTREAFSLFRFEGLTVAQVAEATGAPVKTVESRLKRAHELLSGKLRRYRDEFKDQFQSR
jgi:RNA polymerase sigma-70 factor (ECF subfamily)